MATVPEQLRRLDVLAEALMTERDRLASERRDMLAARAAQCLFGGVLVCALSPGEFQTRADSALSLIEQIEDFVGTRLPALEARARAGDAAAADRAVVAAQRILDAVRGVSPVDDTVRDVSRFVADVKRDAIGTGFGLAAGAALLAVGYLLLRLK